MPTKTRLTPNRIKNFPHPEKGKSFLWDEIVQGLGVLASPQKKNYIFEGRFNKKTIRITIGNTSAWTIEDARKRATEIRRLVDSGVDPRLEKKRREAAETAERDELDRHEVTIADAWPVYIEERRFKWSDRHLLDHQKISHLGGEKKKRGKGKTKPGALASLMPLKLSDITPDTISEWAKRESKTRSTQTLLAFARLRAFVYWCEKKPEYKGLCNLEAVSGDTKKEHLPKAKAKSDTLQREQLPTWFATVRRIPNRVISAYLQALLLTGARREELLCLKWDDIEFTWGSITIHDKVEGQRTIPLTPYVSSLLQGLPQRNEWVFSSPQAKSGRLQEPRKAHNLALEDSGIGHLTIHGLRRSFGNLTEWVEAPVGIVYQIMGHKPSATAEKHYRQRPLDLLRKWHTKIEGWILEQAGIEQPVEVVETKTLELVADNSK